MTDMMKTIASKVVLPEHLEQALPPERREKKVFDSIFGTVLLLVGLAALGGAGTLAYKTHDAPNWVLLGVGLAVGIGFIAAGCLAADRETFLPVFRDVMTFAMWWRSGKKEDA